MYRQSEKKLKQQYLPRCPDNMVNFGLLTAEICWRVWGTPGNFNGFRVLAALLHGTLVVGVSQTLQRWTEGATYIRQGDHHVGHWPIFLVYIWFIVFCALCRLRGVTRPWFICWFCYYVVCILFVCLRRLLPHLSFFFRFYFLSTALLIFSFENRPAPFPGRRS